MDSSAPLSMGFPRQGYWNEWPFPPPRDLPDPGIEPEFPALAGRFFTAEPPGKPRNLITCGWEYKRIGVGCACESLLADDTSGVRTCAFTFFLKSPFCSPSHQYWDILGVPKTPALWAFRLSC